MLVAARWLHFASTFILLGCPAALAYLGPGLSASLAFSAGGEFPATVARTHRLIRVAAFVAVASGIAWLVATMANMSGGFAGVMDPEFRHAFFFETPFGAVAVVRATLLAAVIAVVVVPLGSRLRMLAISMLAVLLVMNQASLGHAAEGGDTLYGVSMKLSYVAHVLAGAAWLGGLPMLALVIAEERHRSGGAIASLPGIVDCLSRFAPVATVAVGIVVLSGIANSAFRIGADLSALWSTTYGTVLLIKLGFAATMLGLASYNRFIAMPRLRRSAPGLKRGMASLHASIGVELVMGICVLGAVAVLGITPPPQ